MREYYPLLVIGAILGLFSAVFTVAYLTIRKQKEAIGFERNMKDGEIVRRLMKYARPHIRSFLLVGLLMLASIAYDIVSPLIVGIAGVNLTDTAKHYLQLMLYMMCFYVVGKAANTVFVHGCFYAGGDMKFGLICDAINLWGFIIPLGFLLAFVFNAPVVLVYCFLRMDEIVKIPAEIIHYKKYGWLRNITKDRT